MSCYAFYKMCQVTFLGIVATDVIVMRNGQRPKNFRKTVNCGLHDLERRPTQDDVKLMDYLLPEKNKGEAQFDMSKCVELSNLIRLMSVF